MRPDAVALGGQRRVIGMRVVAADDIQAARGRRSVGLEVIARVEVEAIAQRMLVLGVGQADLGVPGILRREDLFDDLVAALQPPNQQPYAFVRVGRFGR